MGWSYPLPPSVYGNAQGASAAAAGMSMVAGFPYPTSSAQARPLTGRVMRPRTGRNSLVKREEDDSDDDDEGNGIGLGFSTS